MSEGARILTFIDASVLIAAFRGDEPIRSQALAILADGARRFVSSEFLELETIPKPTFYNRPNEIQWLRRFFDSKSTFPVPSYLALVALAQKKACQYGLSAIDALHLAAALEAGCDELVTTEKRERAFGRVREPGLAIVFLGAPRVSVSL
jgi:predicted nucleic acid-binding protein